MGVQNFPGCHKGQGAIELRSGATAGTLHAQGATEYLVLLAVVLIVALVSVALLGFFPGMASDAQMTQSQIYWRSASPIAITEAMAQWSSNNLTYPYIRLRNTGAYPIRITAIIGGDGIKAPQIWGDKCGMNGSIYSNMSDYFYISPGEETYFSRTGAGWYSTPCDRWIIIRDGTSSSYFVGGASSVCINSTTSPGTVVVKNFGFEYVQYIENTQITKRQIGAKPLVIKCT